jgi:hypothetical protein
MADLNQLSTAQSTHLATTQHHLQLSSELSAAQEANIALEDRMREASASLASELDSANSAVGRVSSRLDRVNHALARVEAASTVLSSLFAIIAIPCRMAHHLHFHLLGLFAMPAIVLYVWKHRGYSFSLIAGYGVS